MPGLLLFWILCFLCAFTGISACCVAIYVFYKIRETGEAVIIIGTQSVKVSGKGAALFFALGALLIVFAILTAIYVNEAQATKARLITLQENFAALQRANEALQKDREVLVAAAEMLHKTSENLPKQVDHAVASRFRNLPSGEHIQTLVSRVDQLGTSLQRVETGQVTLLDEQRQSAQRLNETATLLRGQSEEVRSIAASLARISIQDQVYQMLADALPTRYTPVRWEMVEVKGSRPRTYELRAGSPIIEEKNYTITSEFEGNTLVLNAVVQDEQTKVELEQAIRTKGIESWVKTAGFGLTVNFSFRPR